MSVSAVLLLLLSAAVLGYLVCTLIFPERF
jgi:K+-transporting ATPase KdpF subunit